MDEPRRRGRRPAGEDTKSALLAAATELFIEQGYERATVRTIAERAGVDPAMVSHWFGGKSELFVRAVLPLPVRPTEVVTRLLDGDTSTIGDRIVRTFLEVWDNAGGGAMAALMRSLSAHEAAATALREFFLDQLFTPVIAAVAADEPFDRGQLRATLCASQLVGLGVIRYVLVFEPMASADVDTLAATIAPTLQRYLTGPLP